MGDLIDADRLLAMAPDVAVTAAGTKMRLHAIDELAPSIEKRVSQAIETFYRRFER
ncbi:hypothetical protein M527_04385 [Sphingobium indicum IP26]|nr:hypothetical protein M527_04385 [Sphingobium indicum IP26]